MNTAQNETNTTNKKAKRSRRHWYDHEKLAIIKQVDQGEFFPVKGKPGIIQDPKSGLELRVIVVKMWKDQFVRQGIMKAPPRPSRVAFAEAASNVKFKQTAKQMEQDVTNEISSNKLTIEHLLVQTILENRRLKRMLERKSPGIKTSRIEAKL